MELKKILVGLEGLKVKGDLNIDIKGIDKNSKEIKQGYLFVAIKGFTVDGHQFIESAIKNGATAIMVEEGCNIKGINIPEDITIIMAKNTREGLAISAANFYKNPSTKFKLIGVTGTKGKTTTTYMIKEILEKAGKKVGLIGTIATYINGKKIKDSDRTTPESLELQQLFSRMVEEGVEVVVMEVSSQSLKLHRVDGCKFDIVLFTNFSEDHISKNEHPDMQDYFQSKLKLFDMCKTGIVNVDDLHGAKIPKLFPESNITTYGIDNFANVLAKDITITNAYVDFKVKITDRNERVKTGIPGRFSVYNSLAAICVAQKFGISPEIIKEAYGKIKQDIADILSMLCKRKGVKIVEAEICPDHVHMLVEIPPSISVSYFVGYLKGKSTLMIFERHANLKYKYGNRHFWCRGYYVDTVGKNAKKIQEYIANQLQDDLEYDQMTLKEYIDPFTGEPVKRNKYTTGTEIVPE